jgi:uncharacterized protein YndB with AHSA1/START domain
VEAIHIQSFVAAPPECVWDGLLARADLVLDALPVRAWPDPREEVRPSRLAVSWPSGAGVAGTEVEVTLDAVGSGTVVDVRHRGWPDGPEAQDAVAGHFAGWLQALAALGLLVEAGRDPRASSAALAARQRYFASAEVAASADAAYRALTDARVLARWSQGALDDAGLVDTLESRFARWALPPAGDGARELVVIFRPTPRGTHCALAEYGATGREASSRWPKMLERLAAFLR